MQDVDIKYEDVITQKTVEEHSRVLELREIEEAADKMESERLAEEKSQAIAKKLAPAVIRSEMI